MQHPNLLTSSGSSAPPCASSLARLPETPGAVESWIRKVNDRWLVHSNLNGDTATYLDHLGATDPARLAATCRIVNLLMAGMDPMEDPKPVFYGGVFSLATTEEVARHLHDHLFTKMLVPATPKEEADWLVTHLEIPPDVIQRVRDLRARIQGFAAQAG